MLQSGTGSNWLQTSIICLFKCLVIYVIQSKGTSLLGKVEQKSRTAIRSDSNTHMNTFGDKTDIYYYEFSFHMKHLEYYSPTMNSDMVSLKYAFEEFRSKHWLYTSIFADISVDIPVISHIDSKFKLIKLMGVVKWIQRESRNSRSKYPATRIMVNKLITSKAACLYLDSKYYNNTLNLTHCISSFNHHLSRNIWSFYILHLLMDVNDIPYLKDRTPSQYVIDYPNMQNFMPNVYKLFLNITIQYVWLHFNNGLFSTFKEFEKNIDDIFGEINACIPQFTIRSDTPTTCEKWWIFVEAFTVISGLVSTYCFYKSYTFKKNVKRTFHYILDGQRHLHLDILSNKRDLLSLAEITSSNFKDLRSDFNNLKSDNGIKFDTYLNRLMHTTADIVFYKTYIMSIFFIKFTMTK